MTSRARVSAAFGAALALAVAPAGLAGQELSAVSGRASHLLAPVTADAVPTASLGRGSYDAGSPFCGSPYDVRYGPYGSVYLGGPFGYRPYGYRPFGYRPFGWYGHGGWSAGFGSFYAPFVTRPCSFPLSRGFGWYGRYGGPGWSFWAFDPWIWGYGYNPRLAYGYGYAPMSGWWAPFGYGSAPYGSGREVFEDLMRTRRGSAPPASPTQTAEANPVDAGEDGPDVTRFGSNGIRTGGADLRRVRPDLPPVVVLGGEPGAEAAGRLDGTADARTTRRPLTRETLGDALARSRAELAARRVELMRESAPGDLARRERSPVRGPEVFVRPVEPPRAAGFDRGRSGMPRFEGATPRGGSSFDGRRPGASLGRPAPPRSFSSPPRSSPAPAPARSGGSGSRSGGGKTAAPE